MHFLLPSLSFSKYSEVSSLSGRNPCLSDPKYTNAASKLVSTLETLALKILPLSRFLSLVSLSKSYNLAPSTNATRISSVNDLLINILFIFFSSNREEQAFHAVESESLIGMVAL